MTSSWFHGPSINTVQLAGKHVVNQVHAVDKSHSKNKWIIDTGATDHITPQLNLLTDIQTCEATLQLPNGATTSITHIGNIVLNSTIALTNVLVVPSFAYN